MLFIRSALAAEAVWVAALLAVPLSALVGRRLAVRHGWPVVPTMIAAVSIGLLLAGTLPPLGAGDPALLTWRWEGYPPRVGRCLIDAPFGLRPADGWEVGVNVAMFVLPATMWTLLTRRPGAVLVGFSALSAGVEVAQSLLPRVCSTADWAENSVGAGLGVLLGALLLDGVRRTAALPFARGGVSRRRPLAPPRRRPRTGG